MKTKLIVFLLTLCFLSLDSHDLFANKTLRKAKLNIGIDFQKIAELKSMEELKNVVLDSICNQEGWVKHIFGNDSIPDAVLLSQENGEPRYIIFNNFECAITTNIDEIWPNGSLNLDLDGSGLPNYCIAQWDHTYPQKNHDEFSNENGESRIELGENDDYSYDLDQASHATLVAGTITANGTISDAKGMLPNAKLKAYHSGHTWEEIYNESTNLLVSNHSYAAPCGYVYRGGNFNVWWGIPEIDHDEDYKYGFYDDAYSVPCDKAAYNLPHHMMVFAAGNDRSPSHFSSERTTMVADIKNYDPDTGTVPYLRLDQCDMENPPDPNGSPNGFDCIPQTGVTKNSITVGAVKKLENEYTGRNDVVMSEFSSWGPADDGRIKPDLVAPGVDVFTSKPDLPERTITNLYRYANGTSFSTPVVTGACGILQEHYQNTHNDYSMLSSTVKALLIHTARDAGLSQGPDFKFGWGLLDAETAANKITNDNNVNDIIKEIILNNGENYSKQIYVCKQQDLKVTIAWTDPPGTPAPPSVDPTDKMLVNDLDLRIYYQSTTYYPWSFDKTDVDYPDVAAINTSDNDVDNVEQVFIENAPIGYYTIEVTHKNTLKDDEGEPDKQVFSMIIDNDIEGCTGIPDDCCDNFDYDLAIVDGTCPSGQCNLSIMGFVGYPNTCHSTFEVWEYIDPVWIHKGSGNLGTEGTFEKEFCIDQGDHTYKIQLKDASNNIVCTSELLNVSCGDCCNDNFDIELIDDPLCSDPDNNPETPDICSFKLKISETDPENCTDVTKIKIKQYDGSMGFVDSQELEEPAIDFNGALGRTFDEFGCLNASEFEFDDVNGKLIKKIILFIEFYDGSTLLCKKKVEKICEVECCPEFDFCYEVVNGIYRWSVYWNPIPNECDIQVCTFLIDPHHLTEADVPFSQGWFGYEHVPDLGPVLPDCKNSDGEIICNGSIGNVDPCPGYDPGYNPTGGTTGLVDDTDSGLEIITDFYNIPNPSLDETTVYYKLNGKTNVNIEVYNSIGEKVYDLFNGTSYPGLNRIVFKTGDLTSGSYYVKLRAGNNIKTLPISIIK